MAHRVSRLAALSFALGCVALAIAAWIHVRDVNRWGVVFAQFGGILVVTAGVALFERTRRTLSLLSLVPVLWLPGALIVGSVFLLPGVFRQGVYPLALVSGQAIWYASAFAVPVAYVLGRVGNRSRQWVVATPLVLLVALTPVYYALDAFVLQPTGTAVPPGTFSQPLASIAFVTAVGTWIAIVLYRLGTAVGDPPEPARPIRHPPSVLAAFVSAVLLGSVAYLREWIQIDLGSMLLIVTFCSPVVYFALKAVPVVFDRSDAGVGT